MTVGRRLIVVAHDEPDLFDYIWRDQVGDSNVVVIADRRRGDRRSAPQQVDHDRRRADRRRCDIGELLRVHGWGEVIL
jgi:hypothetical protein